MIEREPRRHRFTVVDNDTVRDRRLSFRARGVLEFVLSQPDNFTTTSEALAEESPEEGRDAIRAALRELEAVGYLERVKVQDPDTGQWSTKAIIRERPPKVTQNGVSAGQPEDGFSVFGPTRADTSFPQVSPRTAFQSSGRPGKTSVSAGPPEDGFSGAIRKTRNTERQGAQRAKANGDTPRWPLQAGPVPTVVPAEDYCGHRNDPAICPDCSGVPLQSGARAPDLYAAAGLRRPGQHPPSSPAAASEAAPSGPASAPSQLTEQLAAGQLPPDTAGDAVA